MLRKAKWIACLPQGLRAASYEGWPGSKSRTGAEIASAKCGARWRCRKVASIRFEVNVISAAICLPNAILAHGLILATQGSPRAETKILRPPALVRTAVSSIAVPSSTHMNAVRGQKNEMLGIKQGVRVADCSQR